MKETDCEFIESISGEDGHLAKSVKTMDRLNGSMTKFLDYLWGPDGTDTFDASCNTCKHFDRKSMTPEEKKERNIYGMPGRCQKKDIAVRGWHRGQYCGFENVQCYENRRTGMTPIEFAQQRHQEWKRDRVRG